MKAQTKLEQSVIPLIGMFNMCPESYETDSNREAIELGIKKGYLIDPKCANKYAKQYLNSLDIKYNNTFYKTWNDVTNKSRFELFVDQVLHYMTTYGTDFNLGEGYKPNVYEGEPELTTYKIIKSCTFTDLYIKCIDMLSSGIALKSETVEYLTDYIVDYIKVYKNINTFDIDNIKNREAIVILCDTLNILPKSGAKLFAHIVYKATGLTMIVKNRETRKIIRANAEKVESIFSKLNDNQLKELATVFNRYKELFIAFKSAISKKAINKISRYSKTYHKPMKRGFWETCLNDNVFEVLSNIESELEKATNFKLIQVMQSIRERLLLASGYYGDNMYIIRNGKIFILDNKYTIDDNYFRWEKIYELCKNQLIKNLSTKACNIKLPKHYELVCPTSEKNFIGDFPMGTNCILGKNSVVGIYWRNDWGTRDFDLSFADVLGNKIAWNSGYYNDNKSVIYSGDMTNAPDGANEIIYFKDDNVPNGIVSINRYSGEAGSKYKLFFGTDTYNNVSDYIAMKNMQSYMVNPNNILLEAEITQGEMTQQTIGMVFDGKFYFYSLSCGYNKILSAVQEKNMNAGEEMVKILKRKSMSAVPLKEILLEAGFTESDTDYQIDLTVIDRSTLIGLFSK